MGKFSDQMLLPYNGVPGYKEKSTSRDAAYAIAPNAETLREKIYAVIKDSGDYGKTADEASAAIGVSPLAGRPRCTELRAAGRIKASINKRRPSSTGRSSLVWVDAE